MNLGFGRPAWTLRHLTYLDDNGVYWEVVVSERGLPSSYRDIYESIVNGKEVERRGNIVMMQIMEDGQVDLH